MKEIFDELLAGWAKAIDEVGLLEEYRKNVVEVKYSSKDCFKLEDFTPEFFPPGNELLEEVPADAILFYEEYGLDANGLPCYCRRINKEGLSIAAGFYRYTQEDVEFVRYNLGNGVPWIFERMKLVEGRKVAYLYAAANGGGHPFVGMTSKQAFDKAKVDEHSIYLSVRQYEFQEGRIVRDVSSNRASGAGYYGFNGIYIYDADGKLMEIKDLSKGGGERLRYVYWDESEGMDGLTERLATEMAEAIVDALSEEKMEVPLAILQLCYHYADDYLPRLNPLLVKEKDDIVKKQKGTVWEDLFLHDNYLDHIKLKGIEKTFTQFMNQVNIREAHDIAREMLQRTSDLLTVGRLRGRIPVDAEFFAYAIDHSVEGHSEEDFKAILLKCGMPEGQYEEWKRRRWVREEGAYEFD